MTKPFYTSVHARGNNILLRWVEDGKKHMAKVPYQPTLFLPSKSDTAPYKSMKGIPLDPIKMEDMKSARSFVERYKDMPDYKIYGSTSFETTFINETFEGSIEYSLDFIKIAMLDIEVFSGSFTESGDVVEGPFPEPDKALYPINAITVYNTFDEKYYTFGLEECYGKKIGTYVHDKEDPKVGNLDVVYRGFRTEEALIQAFLEHWQHHQYDIVTGWNSETFDIPYISKRVENLLSEREMNRLSPWYIVNRRTFNTKFGEQVSYEWLGCASLDLLDLYKKFTFGERVSYKLGYIGEYEVKEKKLSYEEAGTLNKLYGNGPESYNLFIRYNIRDVDLVRRINRKKKLLEQAISIAYKTKSNYKDALGTVAPWSALLYNMLLDEMTVPDLPRIYQGEIDFMGGYVKEPHKGLHKWVVSFDLNSLYPHIMRLLNLGPETIVDRADLPKEIRDNFPTSIDPDYVLEGKIRTDLLKKYDLSVSAKGHFFRRDKRSIFNRKVEEIYNERKAKKSLQKKKEQIVVNIDTILKERGVTLD